MRITRFALDRPVTILMVFFAVVLIGLISWNRLPLELLPSLNYPQITVMTSYENVAPPEIESLVSKPIEEAVGTVQGVSRVSSTSKEGVSLVTLRFEWGVDMSMAALEVREKIDAMRNALPNDIETPVIVKFDPASFPMMTLGVSGRRSLPELTRIATEEIKQKIERIPGVALARISGAVEREILVSLDQGRLFAYGIPISRVVQKLKDANFNFPGGRIEEGRREIRIRTIGKFESLKDVEGLVIATGKGRVPVFLKDVATVQDTYKDPTSYFTVNGKESIGISIFKQADSNTVQVADKVFRAIEKLQKNMKPGVHLVVVYNQAAFIKDAISDLEFSGIIGGGVAFFVLLLFLRSFSSAMIIATAIPISVLGAFALMYMTGISLNIMSLGGLALAVGLLVDNGIVILENIHRHGQKISNRYQAVIAGAEEMYTPVIASTLAHIVVFLPILFVKGISGRFFAQLALTISFSLVISIFVALALNPMLEARSLAARCHTPGEKGNCRVSRHFFPLLMRILRAVGNLIVKIMFRPAWDAVDRGLVGTSGLYKKGLLMALANKKKTIAATITIFIMSIFLIPVIGKEFIPQVDQGSFVTQVTAPAGATLEATAASASEIGKILSGEPEVKKVFIKIGYDKKEKTENILGASKQNVARITAILYEKRDRSTGDVVDAVRAKVARIPGIKVDFILNEDITRFIRQKKQAPELLEIKGPDIAMLRRLTYQTVERLRGVEGLRDIRSSLEVEEPEMQISLDREKAGSYGLSVKDIGDTLKMAMEGEVATKYHGQDHDIDILVRLRKEDRSNIPRLGKILLYTKNRKQIPLSDVAFLTKAKRLRRIQRRDMIRVSVISANISGIKVSDAFEKVKEVTKSIMIPPDYTISLSGQEKEMNQSFHGLWSALLLSVILVYMLLASLFESFLYPFIIMFSVPLAGVGVLLALFITGKAVSLGVYIGSIMLGGIVVNNSIILVDYINTLRKRGFSRDEAIMEAGMARLRPILMTAMTTVFGLVPLALAVGKGAEIRSPLAITVIGGLVTSTLMTLIVVPVLYAFLGGTKGGAIRVPRSENHQ